MPSRITVEGFVAKDPEQRQAGQHTVTTVTVPVGRGRRKNGEWVPDKDDQGKEITDWFDAEFWNEYGAQVGQELMKGYLVKIEGTPQTRAYVKKDGTAGVQNLIVNPEIFIKVKRPSRNTAPVAPGGGFGDSSGQAWGNVPPVQNQAANGGFGNDGFGGDNFGQPQPF